MDPTQGPPSSGTFEVRYTDPAMLRNGAELAAQTRRDGPAAVALVRLRAGEDGEVDPTTIMVEMATDPAVEEPARDIARRTRFSGATINGFAVASSVSIPVHFGCVAPGGA